MSLHRPVRGGSPVGRLAHYGAVESGAILYLRLCLGAEARLDHARDGLIAALGDAAGLRATEALCEIVTILADHGRRPMACHGLACQCVGADEACLAQMIAAAAEGAMEDATLMAALLVRADFAPVLAGAARAFGLGLEQMNRRVRAAHAASSRPSRLH